MCGSMVLSLTRLLLGPCCPLVLVVQYPFFLRCRPLSLCCNATSSRDDEGTGQAADGRDRRRL